MEEQAVKVYATTSVINMSEGTSELFAYTARNIFSHLQLNIVESNCHRVSHIRKDACTMC